MRPILRTTLMMTGGGLGPELMTNTGFETAGAGGADVFDTWMENADAGAIAIEGTLVHSGSRAAKLTAGAGSNTYIRQVDIPVTAGARYRFSFWTRGDGTNGGKYRVYDASNSAWIKDLTETNITAAAYSQVVFDFVAPPGCAWVSLWLYCSGTVGGIVYFDDVSLKRKL